MPNPYFKFKQFTVYHDRCAMKVTTDACFFGAWAAKELLQSTNGHLLDIGTGTGLLSLMIAQKNGLLIDAVEIDIEAAEQAKENIGSSPWKKNIQVFNEDITTFNALSKYDVIISNPPFYENELSSGEEKKDTAHHSSKLTMQQLLKLVKENLKDGGLFFLMYPYKRKNEFEQEMLKTGLYVTKTVLLTQSVKHDPFRIIVKGTDKKIQSEESEVISVWDKDQQYTRAFSELLADYYLYL
jgi:tRNA1Val (adenine37-N6)-methyltransferase